MQVFCTTKNKLRVLEGQNPENKERDIKEQKELASMGWHCITVWECQLKPALREQTFKSLEYTLNHIYLEDRIIKSYAILEEEKQLVAESKIDSYHL